ncbi:N-acyl homoserine lactonase family protein [Paracoccus sp. (in: a-proteobacteria)]|uniref:N-acyl homoserine lactonase family protein n=1 Tax=Paracoccus sp. TaxID=267 RepID=UPI002AFE69D2|nr:N-acyl homoserine lactonase family protein [Paracoccus sp. (in: a-proteobacteria)]
MSVNHFPSDAPDDEGVYEIWSMCYARGERRVHDHFMFPDMHDGPMPLDYNLWILRNARRVILIDTGFAPRAAIARNRPLIFDPIEGLRQIGIDPDEIEDIVITHLHYDHAGNIDRFGKARFHVQDGEVEFATGRCMCDQHHRFPYDVEDIVSLVRRLHADRVVFHDGDGELFPGVTLRAFPGHSAVVQGVRVMTARGPVLLASDATHYFANILNMKPFVLTLDTVATLDSYQRALALAGGADRLIPGHDPKIRRLYPAHDVNGIELLALHEVPNHVPAEELARTNDY